MRTFNRWHTLVKQQLRTLGLTHPQFVVLASLGYLSQDGSAVTQAMISQISGMDPMSVSQVLTLLEKHDLVSRGPHPVDSRAKAVTMTATGLSSLRAALPIVEGIDVEFFGRLEEEESAFISMLHRLNN